VVKTLSFLAYQQVDLASFVRNILIPRFLLCIFHSPLTFLSNHTLNYSYNPLSKTQYTLDILVPTYS
jgi:hypothetical protein